MLKIIVLLKLCGLHAVFTFPFYLGDKLFSSIKVGLCFYMVVVFSLNISILLEHTYFAWTYLFCLNKWLLCLLAPKAIKSCLYWFLQYYMLKHVSNYTFSLFQTVNHNNSFWAFTPISKDLATPYLRKTVKLNWSVPLLV